MGVRSLRQKLLFIILPLCLLPLIGISFFSYYQAKGRITEDRIALYLEQIAQGVADTIGLTLLEKREETQAMSLQFVEFLKNPQGDSPVLLLNQFLLIHEVYDLLILFDIDGRIVLTNSIDRSSLPEKPDLLDRQALRGLRGQALADFTLSVDWLQQVRSGRFGYLDWHRSPLVHSLYDYSKDDLARSYSVGFAVPVYDSRGLVVGGLMALMNWEYVQEILDHLEEDLEYRSLRSGYGFMFGKDRDTIIAHKYRLNRMLPNFPPQDLLILNNYETSLTRDHQLVRLSEAVEQVMRTDPIQRVATNVEYEYPPGSEKISGLAAIDHVYFEWLCGVGINNEEIFAPVQELKNVLVAAALASSLLIAVLTFAIARSITTPLKKLTVGASIIAGGDLSQRVDVSTRDETGELARTFNEMAESLQERSQALIDLNRRLEEKVEERTRALQQSHRQVESAYEELKEAQVQLVQSEKMGSLGQLVAGIGHEIKNPLNFIYGNTDFLRSYIRSLKQLLGEYEQGVKEPPSGVTELKKRINYDFLVEDLDTLVANFEEGAKRINSIISDLRAFSRMDSDEMRPIDIHEPLELALNLLKHEYRDHIQIHREYGNLPQVSCHSGKMSQVFMNVLANACQAIDGGGNIWIRTTLVDNKVAIEIKDDGPGIAPEVVNRIFEPFFTTKAVGDGTGLGLSISYGIIQQHSGRIFVSSPAAKGGTRFMIELPVTK